MRSSLFWDVTQPVFAGVYRRFGTAYQSFWTACPSKMGLLGSLQMSVHNYQHTLRKISEERKHLQPVVLYVNNNTHHVMCQNTAILIIGIFEGERPGPS
jgi:hypothetical protein